MKTPETNKKLTPKQEAYYNKLEREKEKRALARQLVYWKQLDQEHKQILLNLKQVELFCKNLNSLINEARAIMKNRKTQIIKYRK
ncbi:MAG: hypothetical protein KIS94_05720 [Chitinophagales bacterium]|nr:hypothetical protein [Chitinophagales bacterium]